MCRCLQLVLSFVCVCVRVCAQWTHHLAFVMIRDGLFKSSSPRVGIRLRPLSGVNGVFARLALKVFEDTRPDVTCLQPPAPSLLIDLFAPCFLFIYFF